MLAAYATDVPKKVNPVVTAPVGMEAVLAAKPTWAKSPAVGTIYIDLVAPKVTASLFGEITQAVVVSSRSIAKVTFVATEAKDGFPLLPIYASPFQMSEAKWILESLGILPSA